MLSFVPVTAGTEQLNIIAGIGSALRHGDNMINMVTPECSGRWKGFLTDGAFVLL